MKVTISKADLHKYIEQQDLEHLTVLFDLEDSGWFFKHGSQWQECPKLSIPIPCFDPDGSGAEYEYMRDDLSNHLTPEQFEIMEENKDEHRLDLYDVLEELDQKNISGLENVKPPAFGWVKGWEDVKGILVEFLADQWLNSLKKNHWEWLYKEMNLILEDSSHFEELEPVEVEVLD